jgi:UDP-N-acetylmuramyl tripeptide synthase
VGGRDRGCWVGRDPFHPSLSGRGDPCPRTLLGRHSVHTALRAAAIGLVEGLDWSDIVTGLRSDSPQLRLVAVKGPNESLLLDDTYNASPASTIAALNLLAELENRHVAVLGDMLELGSYEEAGHRLVGRRVVEVADLLITVGELGQMIAEEALAAGMPSEKVIILPDADAAIRVLPGLVEERDMVLIKGSRGVGLDRLVDTLTRPMESRNQDWGLEPEGEGPVMSLALTLGGVSFMLAIIWGAPFVRLLREFGLGSAFAWRDQSRTLPRWAHPPWGGY